MTIEKSRNRTKPSKINRNGICSLRDKSILCPELIGMRNIVEAEREIVRPIGLDASDENGFLFIPKCIKLLHGTYDIKLDYNNTRSTMCAVVKTKHHASCMIDPAATLPRNHLAERLLRQGRTGDGEVFGWDDAELYGDAVLVDDVRRHWSINRYASPDIDLADLCDDLTTPRRLRGYPNGGIHSILFEEEPNSDDLLYLVMRFL